jgi:hypothetical protein
MEWGVGRGEVGAGAGNAVEGERDRCLMGYATACAMLQGRCAECFVVGVCTLWVGARRAEWEPLVGKAHSGPGLMKGPP